MSRTFNITKGFRQITLVFPIRQAGNKEKTKNNHLARKRQNLQKVTLRVINCKIAKIFRHLEVRFTIDHVTSQKYKLEPITRPLLTYLLETGIITKSIESQR